MSANFSPDTVRVIFAGARNCHLHNHRPHRRQNGNQDHADPAQWIVVFAAIAAEHAGKHREIGKRRNRTGDGCRNRHGQGIAVFDMGEFMGHDTGDLVAIKQFQQTRCCRHRRIFRIAPGGKGIGLRVFNHIDLGHWQTGITRQIAHHGNQFRRSAIINLFCTAHPKQHGIGIPIGEHIHRPGKQQRNDHALLPADHHANGTKQRGQPRQQQTCTHIVHGRTPFSTNLSNDR